MFVFYFVPYNQFSKNKKNYPDYKFEKPQLAIIIVHFLLHVNLIAVGAVLASAANYSFYTSAAWIMLICMVPSFLACFYILATIFSGCFINFIKKEDFSLNQISEHLNSSHPINSYFFYVKGKVRGRKGSYYTCYSKNGFSIPVQTNRYLPDFNPNENWPNFFYYNIIQKVNMTDELFLYVERIREKIYSCENEHPVEIDYYPLIEGKKLILSEGKKIPSKMKKPNAIASLIFGLGVYPEMLEKSIPIKNYEQSVFADVVPGFDYKEQLGKIECSAIGKCKTKNKMPHM